MDRMLLRCSLTATIVLTPTIASAHIAMTFPTPRSTEQKAEHCGPVGSVRGTNVATFRPGDTITVRWNETIGHPGWYRISFQQDGDAFEIPPASDGPYGDGTPGGNFPTEDLTGMTDPGTGSLIILDRIPDGAGTGPYTQQITLPNVECDNCTLQLIQVMTSAHGPYDEPGGNDIYFQCADIVLSNSAPPPDAATGDASGNPAGDAGPGGGGTTGGCSAGGGAPSGILTVLSLVWLRRRRTSRRA